MCTGKIIRNWFDWKSNRKLSRKRSWISWSSGSLPTSVTNFGPRLLWYLLHWKYFGRKWPTSRYFVSLTWSIKMHKSCIHLSTSYLIFVRWRWKWKNFILPRAIWKSLCQHCMLIFNPLPRKSSWIFVWSFQLLIGIWILTMKNCIAF